jgi:fermentation-respiration switch protein FrsA (DUF1100 family)
MQRINTAIEFDAIQNLLREDHIRRYQTGEVSYLPYYAPDGQPHVLPNSTPYFERTKGDSHGRFENRMSLESIEQFVHFAPKGNIDAISPTPLRMIVADKDLLTPPDLALAAYSRAHEPKALVFLKEEHTLMRTKEKLSKLPHPPQ